MLLDEQEKAEKLLLLFSKYFAALMIKESAGRFDFTALCGMHQYIFQGVYEWAGEIRTINIEKSEAGYEATEGRIKKVFLE